MTRVRFVYLTFLVATVFVRVAVAQSPEAIELRGPTPAVIRLGESTLVEIVVRGRTAKPEAPGLPPVAGLGYVVGSPSRVHKSSFRNGRASFDVQEVVFRVEITPDRVGRFVVPSFGMQTGTRVQTVRAFRFDVVATETTASYVRVEALPQRVYVNEPVRFVFDVGVDGRVELFQDRIREGLFDRLFVRAPWFEDPTGFVAAAISADAVGGGETRIVGWNDAATYAAYTPARRVGDDGICSRYTFTRTLIPTQPGRVEVPRVVVTLSTKGRLGRPDLFGQRRQREKKVRLHGEPVVIEVVPVPSEGRPASYTNAVGRFRVSVSSDKSRCRVGDSIKFELLIRGRGNLEFLDPPELVAADGFHVLGTNVVREQDAVRVTFDMTPLEETVDALPSLDWSFFDTTPGVEAFVEVATDRVPLTVDPAPEGSGLATLPGADDAAVVAGEDDIFDMKDLEVGEPIRLTCRSGLGVRAAWVFGPWFAVVGFAFWLTARKRSRADVRGRRAAGARNHFQAVLARGDATAALVAYLADRLDVPDAAVIGPDLAERLRTAGVDDELAGEIQAAIDAGTAARYGGGVGMDNAQAEALVARLGPVPLRADAASKIVMSVLGCVLGSIGGVGQLSAQDFVGAVDQGRELTNPAVAYRAGDYSAAATGFESLANRPGADRRLFYNLGNARFREGKLADALAAYERARLAMPRDEELLANIGLVERRLDLATGEGESFYESITGIRDRFTSTELMWFAVVANFLAAALLVAGRRGWRWLGLVFVVPAVLLALEVLWLGPTRAPRAVVLPTHVDVVAEPREGLEPILRLRRGVRVELLSEGEAWASVRVEGRRGYLPAAAVRAIH